METYCNSDLVAEWKAACAVPLPTHPSGPSYFDSMIAWSEFQNATHWSRKRVSDARGEINGRVRRATRAMIEEFRGFIENGEVVLTGLQAKPVSAEKRVRIPLAYTRLLRFPSWTRVAALDRVYVDVRVYRVQGADKAVAPEEEDATVDDAPPTARQLPRGRKNSEGLIEAALRQHWTDAQAIARRSSTGTPSWMTLAKMVNKRWHKCPSANILDLLGHL